MTIVLMSVGYFLGCLRYNGILEDNKSSLFLTDINYVG